MAEERKRKLRARKTTNGNTAGKAPAPKAASADDQQTGKDILNAEDTVLEETTLGEETWQQEAMPEDVMPDDADILVVEVIPLRGQGGDEANALIDPDAPDLTPPDERITPQETARDRARGQQVLADLDELDREAAELLAAEDSPARSSASPPDRNTTDTTAALGSVAMPMTTGKDTAPLPVTQGQPTTRMPMMQRAWHGPRAHAASPAGDTTQEAISAINATTQTQAPQPTMMGTQPALPFDERWLSLIGGGALVVTGAIRRGWPGAVMGVLGAGLLARGIIQTVRGRGAYRALTVERSVTINRTPKELYRFWRNFENLPRFMQHLEAVTVLDELRSHWKAKAPANTTVEWDTVIIEDEPNARIVWESTKDAQVANAGVVTFTPAPGGRGTEVRVRLRYLPPAGRLGAVVAALFGENPGQQLHEDLRHLKEILETGEIPTTEGQPAGGKRAKR
jgi:uncharacterized membrane protein